MEAKEPRVFINLILYIFFVTDIYQVYRIQNCFIDDIFYDESIRFPAWIPYILYRGLFPSFHQTKDYKCPNLGLYDFRICDSSHNEKGFLDSAFINVTRHDAFSYSIALCIFIKTKTRVWKPFLRTLQAH